MTKVTATPDTKNMAGHRRRREASYAKGFADGQAARADTPADAGQPHTEAPDSQTLHDIDGTISALENGASVSTDALLNVLRWSRDELAAPSQAPVAVKALEDAARIGWEHGRKSWCPAGVLADEPRTERDWRDSLLIDIKPKLSALAEAPQPAQSAEPEFETAPDNGTREDVIAYLLDCARRWVPEARIIGNARAGDVVRALSSQPAPSVRKAWPNGSDRTVPAALRFLAENDRPSGGSDTYNSEHLYQLADEIEAMAKRQLSPPAHGAVEALREIVALEAKGASPHGKWRDAWRIANAALAQPASLEGWRDMATAPKDGTRILACGIKYGASVDIIKWGTGRYLGRKQGYRQTWVNHPGNEVQPTGWMPLPAAPSKGA